MSGKVKEKLKEEEDGGRKLSKNAFVATSSVFIRSSALNILFAFIGLQKY